MPRRARLFGIAAVASCVTAATVFAGANQPTGAFGLAQRAARGRLPRIFAVSSKRMPALSGGLVASAREARKNVQPSNPTTLPASITLGCGDRTSDADVRVNQDCTLRRQTDGAIAVSPLNPENLIAGQNDSSLGWNHCGFDYSLDGGTHWGGGTPPFFQRGNHPVKGHSLDHNSATLHTYDAASNPSITFDSRGNAFISCLVFDINDPANGILVARSPAIAGGSFYDNIPAYSGKESDPADDVVIEDNTVDATADGDALAADRFASSPYRDDVYITWTEFIASPRCTQGGVCSSPIYFSRSTNHALTWSNPVEISGNSPTLCFDGNLFDPRRKPHDCDLDEGSQPVVLPNGNLVVVFNNSNTEGSDINDQLLAVVSSNGGRSWSHPTLVADDIVQGEPQCNLGDGNGPEECIPGPFIRGNDDPQVAVDPSDGDLYAVWNDFSLGRYAIHIAESTDHGKTWTVALGSVDSGARDCYMPAVGVSATTHQLVVGYYSSARVPHEDKHSGLFKSGIDGAGTEPTDYRLSTASSVVGPWQSEIVSPSFGPPDGDQAGYNGDYSGLTVAGDVAHPMWSDTRNTFTTATGIFSDEDVFTTAKPLPAP